MQPHVSIDATWIAGCRRRSGRPCPTRERGVGGGLVAGLPVPDVVVLLVLAAILAQHGCIGLERLERVDHDRQRLVVDVDSVDRVRGLVAGLGDDRRHLLAWYMTSSTGSTICLSPARVGIQWSPAFSSPCR
jgi:hypothetical protein